MKPLENERYGMIRLFEACISALALLVEQDAQLFTWKRGRIAICHCLSQHLEHLVFSNGQNGQNQKYFFDLYASIGGGISRLVPDILLHNRNEAEPERRMAIVWREGYLSEEELGALHDLKNKALCDLTLAIALLPQKDYLLIYRADESRIDYYHFNKTDAHCYLLKQREVCELSTDKSQLRLGIKNLR
jgi:hypothetical protein